MLDDDEVQREVDSAQAQLDGRYGRIIIIVLSVVLLFTSVAAVLSSGSIAATLAVVDRGHGLLLIAPVVLWAGFAIVLGARDDRRHLRSMTLAWLVSLVLIGIQLLGGSASPRETSVLALSPVGTLIFMLLVAYRQEGALERSVRTRALVEGYPGIRPILLVLAAIGFIVASLAAWELLGTYYAALVDTL